MDRFKIYVTSILNFFLSLTTTNPLLSACLGNKELAFMVSIETLHNPPLSLGDCLHGCYFLKN